VFSNEHSRVEKRARRDHERFAANSATARVKCLDATAANLHPQSLASEKLDAALANELGDGLPV